MRGGELRVGIVLSGESLLGWRALLAAGLRVDGHHVGFLKGPIDQEPPGTSLLTRLEGLVYRRAPAALSGADPVSFTQQPFDLVIDGGTTAADRAGALLTLSCDGLPCAAGTCAALLDGRAPLIEAHVRTPSDGQEARVGSARPALEQPQIFFRSRECVDGAIAEVARSAVRRFSQGVSFAAQETLPSQRVDRVHSHPLAFGLGSLAAKVSARLTALAGGGARWSVAWRLTSGDEVAERLRWSAFAFHRLADDGRRYYADPFIAFKDDRAFVFCEEFPYATGRGILSWFEIKEGRPVGQPRPALECPYHLSYPMVFFRNGAYWMIPETSAANRIELWRAESFPDKWTRAGVLVDNVAASDTTLLESGGRLWLFATVAEEGRSSWDRLYLWSADQLHGPWTAHPGNPVLIDASCARPAGMPFRKGESWIRPVQDCSRIYGGAMSLQRIDRLDMTGFVQSHVADLPPPGGLGAIGAHTLNASGGLEVIDVFGAGRARGRQATDAREPQ